MEGSRSPRAERRTPAYHGPAGMPPRSSNEADEAGEDDFAQRPEVYVGAAFAGGLAFAGLLRWLGR